MTKVFVLGSCVSRDPLELVEHPFELVGYLARSSFASGFDTAPAAAELKANVGMIASSFQRRMVENDLSRGSASQLLGSTADVILIDLIDERYPLAAPGSGGLVTLSSELLSTGLAIADDARIAFDDERHFDSWKRGVDAFAACGVDLSRVVINEAFWAETTETGEQISSAGWIQRNNVGLARRYAYLRTFPFASIIYPPHLLVARSDHRWGLAPYHFGNATYRYCLDELSLIVNGQRAVRDSCRV
jgi:hypothetical protein